MHVNLPFGYLYLAPESVLVNSQLRTASSDQTHHLASSLPPICNRQSGISNDIVPPHPSAISKGLGLPQNRRIGRPEFRLRYSYVGKIRRKPHSAGSRPLGHPRSSLACGPRSSPSRNGRSCAVRDVADSWAGRGQRSMDCSPDCRFVGGPVLGSARSPVGGLPGNSGRRLERYGTGRPGVNGEGRLRCGRPSDSVRSRLSRPVSA
jgi:hypothetical protein